MLHSSRAAERRSSAPPADSVLRSNRDAQRASEARAAGNPTPGPRLQHAARRRRHQPGKERRHALDQPRRVHDRRGVRLVVVHKLRERRERRAPRGAAGAEHESREARQDPGARRTPTGFGLQPTRVPRAPAHHVPDALGRSLLRAARRSREERGEVAHTQRPEVAERFDDAGGMQPGAGPAAPRPAGPCRVANVAPISARESPASSAPRAAANCPGVTPAGCPSPAASSSVRTCRERRRET